MVHNDSALDQSVNNKIGVLNDDDHIKSETQLTLTKEISIVTIQKGIVLLKNYLDSPTQSKLLETAKELNIFSDHHYCRNEKAKNIHMITLSRKDIPDFILDIYRKVINLAHKQSKSIGATFKPSKCVVNYYNLSSKLSLHDELGETGAVISLSLGNNGIFRYKNTWKKSCKEKFITLESGDVLVFGGCARGIVHGVDSIERNTGPLQEQFVGRINFNIREK
ncbi:2OG-Fe(II) oxygenase superfamily-domain-containing protein [Globomyces pollinis-pini]|nr:2OG-Fe(II) oxygenase superfamily-domain-containing protein [Globomyces pollinis-pini]